WQSTIGWRQARVLARMLSAPRHEQFRCPSCEASPPVGELWLCANCKQRFDTFREGGVCPHCGARFAATVCPECSRRHPLAEWVPRTAGPGAAPPQNMLDTSEIVVAAPSVPPGLFPGG